MYWLLLGVSPHMAANLAAAAATTLPRGQALSARYAPFHSLARSIYSTPHPNLNINNWIKGVQRYIFMFKIGSP